MCSHQYCVSGFFLVLLLLLCNSDARDCGSNSTIKLKDMYLDLTLIEPRKTENELFWDFLGLKQRMRITSFEDEVRRGFKSATVERVIVNDIAGSGPFDCLFGPLEPDVLSLPSILLDTPTNNMLLGAAITPTYLDMRRTYQNTPVGRVWSEPIDGPVVRVVVMFTDVYRTDAATGTSPFNRDGGGTCLSDYPDQKDVKYYFSKRGILLLLVTPVEQTAAKWREVFDARDVHIYPDLSGSTFVTYSRGGDTMSTFVRNRILELACNFKASPDAASDNSDKGTHENDASTEVPDHTKNENGNRATSTAMYSAPGLQTTPPTAPTTTATVPVSGVRSVCSRSVPLCFFWSQLWVLGLLVVLSATA